MLCDSGHCDITAQAPSLTGGHMREDLIVAPNLIHFTVSLTDTGAGPGSYLDPRLVCSTAYYDPLPLGIRWTLEE